MARSSNDINPLRGQRGSASIWFVLCLPVLLGFAALSVDLARLNLIKAELQNAADAAALGGAQSLNDAGGNPYNWGAASAKALDVAQSNVANAEQIENAVVETGYWNLQTSTWNGGAPASGDVAAVRVTVPISSAANNGPVNFFFAPMIGFDNSDIQATAVAVRPAAGGGTGVFPFVINKTMFDKYWDYTTNGPKLNPATGQPYTQSLGMNSNQFGDVDSGTWTTFSSQTNSAAAIKALIASGNTTPMEIGDPTWIQTGVEDALFKQIKNNIDVPLFVVEHVVVNTYQPIYAIGAFHITNIKKINGKSFIQGYFIKSLSLGTLNPGSGNGKPFGVYSPPVLVN